MWYLSSLRKLSSCSSLTGALKSISYMPCRYAPALLGSGHSVGGEVENHFLHWPSISGMNVGLLAAKHGITTPYALSFQSCIHSAGQKDIEMGWNFKSLDHVREIVEQDKPRFSRYSVEQNTDFVLINMKRNNTFINVLDSKGNTKYKASAGCMEIGGGKVSRYGAEAAAEFVGRKVREMGLRSVVMRVKGFTYFKKKRQAIMSFREGFSNSRNDLNPIVYIEDVTQRPHNGCRLPKKRRI